MLTEAHYKLTANQPSDIQVGIIGLLGTGHSNFHILIRLTPYIRSKTVLNRHFLGQKWLSKRASIIISDDTQQYTKNLKMVT